FAPLPGTGRGVGDECGFQDGAGIVGHGAAGVVPSRRAAIIAAGPAALRLVHAQPLWQGTAAVAPCAHHRGAAPGGSAPSTSPRGEAADAWSADEGQAG